MLHSTCSSSPTTTDILYSTANLLPFSSSSIFDLVNVHDQLVDQVDLKDLIGDPYCTFHVHVQQLLMFFVSLSKSPAIFFKPTF